MGAAPAPRTRLVDGDVWWHSRGISLAHARMVSLTLDQTWGCPPAGEDSMGHGLR